jgi:hypothetical protein
MGRIRIRQKILRIRNADFIGAFLKHIKKTDSRAHFYTEEHSCTGRKIETNSRMHNRVTPLLNRQNRQVIHCYVAGSIPAVTPRYCTEEK